MAYKELRHLGAIYAEVQPQAGKKFFEIDREDGETFVWIGRFHFILTPWRRLVTGAVALWGFLTGPTQLFWGFKTGAAAVIAIAAAVAEPTSTVAPKVTADTLPPSWEALLTWDAELKSLEVSVCEALAFSSTSQ